MSLISSKSSLNNIVNLKFIMKRFATRLFVLMC